MSDVTLTREEYNALVADRDRARAIAVHLEGENARLLAALDGIQRSVIDSALLCAEAIVKGEVSHD
jgi:hypothetical protein